MSRKTYTPGYRAHVIALARGGRGAESLARQFERTAQTVRAWVQAADVAGPGPVAQDEDARIRALERKISVLEEEKEIVKKPAAWFAADSASFPKKASRS